MIDTVRLNFYKARGVHLELFLEHPRLFSVEITIDIKFLNANLCRMFARLPLFGQMPWYFGQSERSSTSMTNFGRGRRGGLDAGAVQTSQERRFSNDISDHRHQACFTAPGTEQRPVSSPARPSHIWSFTRLYPKPLRSIATRLNPTLTRILVPSTSAQP